MSGEMGGVPQATNGTSAQAGGKSEFGIRVTFEGKPLPKKGIDGILASYLPKGMTRAKLKTMVANLLAALRALKAADSKFNQEQVVKTLKENKVALENLIKLGEITGDDLIEELLAAAGIKVYDCLSEAGKAQVEQALKSLEASASEYRKDPTQAKWENLVALNKKFSKLIHNMDANLFYNRMNAVLNASQIKPGTKPAAASRSAESNSIVGKKWEGKALDPQQPKPQDDAKPAAPPAPARPQGLDENGYRAWQAVSKISGRSDAVELDKFQKAWKDGKIDLDEARDLGIAGKDDQLFKAADNRMRVSISGYSGKGENDHYLSVEELEEVVKVAEEYARMSGQVDATTTFAMYRTMYLMDVDFEGIRNKLDSYCRDGDAGFRGLEAKKLTDTAYLEGQFKALKSSVSTELFNLIIEQVSRGRISDGKSLGLYIFSSAMASMTGNYDGFKVGDLKAKVDSGKIGRYVPKRPETSAEDFAEWVREGKVKEESKETGGSERTDDQKQRELLAKLQLAKKPSEALEVYRKNYSELKGSTQALALLKESLQTALQLAIEKKELTGLIDEYNSCEKSINSLASEVQTGLKGNVNAYRFQLAMELGKSDKKTEKDLAYGVIDGIPDGNKITWTKTESGKVSSISLTKAEAKFVLAHQSLKETAPMDAAIKEPSKYSAIELAAAYMYRAEVTLERSKTNKEREAAFADYKEAYKKAAAGEAEKDDAPKATEYRENAKRGMNNAIQNLSQTMVSGKDKAAKAANKDLVALMTKLKKEFAETVKGEAEAKTETVKGKKGPSDKAVKKSSLDPALISLADQAIKSESGKIMWTIFKLNGTPIDDATKAKVREYIKRKLPKDKELKDDRISKKA